MTGIFSSCFCPRSSSLHAAPWMFWPHYIRMSSVQLRAGFDCCLSPFIIPNITVFNKQSSVIWHSTYMTEEWAFSFRLCPSLFTLVWQPRRAADTSTNWRQSLFCCCTASMEQASDGAETAAIDGLVSSWSENISVSFCLRAPGYGLTLWWVLGLLVGAQ